MTFRWTIIFFLPALLGSCNDGSEPGDGDGDATERPDCNPLDTGLCMLPWPSMYALRDDDSSVTGFRVDMDEAQLPRNNEGVGLDPFAWNEKDGFSINSALILDAPGVVLDDVPTPFNVGRYTEETIDVVVVDVQTGERHPIWVEVDDTAYDADGNLLVGQQLTFIRPAAPFEFDRRYVVGVRGLVDASGSPVPIAGKFSALRDGTAEDGSWLATEAARFEQDVFPLLEEQGFGRDELQLAWDFHTMSRDSTLGRLEQIRDLALDWVDDNGWTYDLQPGSSPRVEGVVDRDCSQEGEHIARDIEGWFEAPLFTHKDEPENPTTEELEGWLVRDDNGDSYVNGTTKVPFLIRIPCSVAEDKPAGGAPILQYGHGLLGGYGEARTGYLREMADEYGFIILAQNWTGFYTEDYVPIISNLTRAPGNFAAINERSMQGLVEKVLGPRFVREALSEDDAGSFDGTNVISKDTVYYYGNSQGGIMGSALMGLSPELDRGVLGVNGGPYSLLLPRSKDFDPFFDILRQYYDDHRDIMMFVVGLTQQVWDPVEPGGWMHDLGRDTGKEVLMQVAIYDNQVTTLGSQIQARAYDAFIPKPSVRDVWGVDVVDVGDDGVTGSAYVEWLYPDLPPEFEEAFPPGREEDLEGTSFEGCAQADPHEGPRREKAAQDQLWTFLSTGKVVQNCDETDGCVSEKKYCFP